MKFKKGDIVNVINSGSCYSRYDEWLETRKREIPHEYYKKWEYGKIITDTTLCFRVLLVKKHLNFDTYLALIENETGVYIINVDGLEIV